MLPLMPSSVKWIILVLVAVVAVSPLGEAFDRSDDWSQDGSDLALYTICVFCFLWLSLMQRGRVTIARLASSGIAIQPTNPPMAHESGQRNAPAEERALFLTFCDLRI